MVNSILFVTKERQLSAAISSQMSGEKLSLEQFSALLKNIDSDIDPAASQLWKEGVNTEAFLRKLTKQDMHMLFADS